MKVYQVPSIKTGTPFQRPSWRYDALLNPHKYGLVDFISEIQKDAGCLKRLITKGVKPSSVYIVPDYFRQLQGELPKHLADELGVVWDKHWKRKNKGKKLRFRESNLTEVPMSWNVGKSLAIEDEYFKRLILHTFNYKYDEDIEFAIRFYHSEENSELKRYFGYSFYAGLSDQDIAKRWRITVPRAKAIRMLFFDFAHFPKDRVAAWVMLRQLAEMGEIEVEDFERYKRIYDLGELGIKMVADYHNLTYDEKVKVEEFLGSSAVVNTINLNMSIRTAKDAYAYSNIIANFSRMSLVREELKQKEATLRLTELQIQKTAKEANLVTEDINYSEDEKLLAYMKEVSKFDNDPQFKTVLDLNNL